MTLRMPCFQYRIADIKVSCLTCNQIKACSYVQLKYKYSCKWPVTNILTVRKAMFILISLVEKEIVLTNFEFQIAEKCIYNLL